MGEELNGLLCASGPIGAHQHFSTGSGAEPGLVRYPAVILTWSAGVPTSRETVGSEATDPKSSLSHRSGERSDRQWPPRAARTARFAVILPGSCTDHVRRHAVRARESSLPRPVTLVVSVNSLAPASPIAGTSLGSTPTAGYNPLFFTAKVSFPWSSRISASRIIPGEATPSPRLQHPNNENSRLVLCLINSPTSQPPVSPPSSPRS